jgi:serine/threonine protein kinase
MTDPPRCVGCGTETLSGLSAGGLCPACLLRLAEPPSVTRPPDPRRPEARGLIAPGERFGSYTIERLLGKGGMGEVYEAEEESGRRIALKVLTRGLDDATDRARFLREGRLAASISHPHTVYIYGSDEIEGLPVIAMELATGGSLKDRVQASGPLPPAAAVDAILQVIAGLETAATAGILHRDIKPSNCFVDAEGRVKVGDFGLSISTVARTERDLTLTGGFQGTPAFASPEQLRGDDLDVRSDIYSVGATLHYLLTGRPPFEETNVLRLATRIAEQAAHALPELERTAPPGLAAIVRRCLANSPSDRFQTYSALARELDLFSSNVPRPASVGPRVGAALIDWLIVGLLLAPAAVFLEGIGTE